jgi:hypothetical protein
VRWTLASEVASDARRFSTVSVGTAGAKRVDMLTTLDSSDLERVTGGAGGLPLSGDVNQTIAPITNWGGSLTINNTTVQAAPKPPTTVLEYYKLHPELRIGSPRPVGGYGPMLGRGR